MTKITSASIIVLTVSMFITACGGTSSSKTNNPTEAVKKEVSRSDLARSLKTSITCTTSGGSWEKVGRLQAFACVLPARDAGKACTDSSQCEVLCLTNDRSVKPGSEVSGQCNASTNVFGCKTRVSNGKAEATLCID